MNSIYVYTLNSCITRESHQEQRIGPDSSLHVNNSDNNERSQNNVHTEEQNENSSPEPIIITDEDTPVNNIMDITMKSQSDDNIQSKVEAIIAEMQHSGIDQNPVECL